MSECVCVCFCVCMHVRVCVSRHQHLFDTVRPNPFLHILVMAIICAQSQSISNLHSPLPVTSHTHLAHSHLQSPPPHSFSPISPILSPILSLILCIDQRDPLLLSEEDPRPPIPSRPRKENHPVHSPCAL